MLTDTKLMEYSVDCREAVLTKLMTLPPEVPWLSKSYTVYPDSSEIM